jgi:hypothetical protein
MLGKRNARERRTGRKRAVLIVEITRAAGRKSWRSFTVTI